MAIKELFAKNLKYYRFQKNLSQEKLAELSELNPKNISDYERAVACPTLPTIDKIANALNIEVYLLFKMDHINERLDDRIDIHNNRKKI